MELIAVPSMEAFVLKFTKNKSILGYHWGSASLVADFMVVHSLGVDFFKQMDDPLRMVLMKSHSYSTVQYWFEPRSGTVVLAHTPTKPGSMRVYHFYQGRTPKFDGPKFKLVQQVPSTATWTSRLPNCLSLTSFAASASPDAHKCTLVKLYNSVAFLHLSTTSGQLQLYKVEAERVELLPISIVHAPGPYDLFVIDSVIVIQSLQQQEESFYDTKVADFQNEPFVVVKYRTQAISQEESTEVSNLVDVAISGQYQAVGRIEKKEALLDGLIRVDQDIFVDIKEGLCYKKTLDCLELITSQSDLTTQLLFLLRRTGRKLDALAFLRDQILQQTMLENLFAFFATIAQVYRTAARERQGSPTRRHTLPDVRSSFNIDGELKTEAGTTVVLQTDVYSHVLLDVYEDKTVPSKYVTSVLLEYQRSLVDSDIRVNPNIQLLIAEQLVRTKNYVLLQNMLRYRVLGDSKEISHLLIAIANPGNYVHYPPALQLALDMLIRLKNYHEIANLLIERKMLYEVLACMDTDQVQTELGLILEAVNKLGGGEMAEMAKGYLVRHKALGG